MDDSLLNISDGIQSLIHHSPNRPIAEMNFIEFFNPSEPETSCLLEMLFSFRNRNGDFQIFLSFAEKFLEPLGFNIQNIHRPEIHREEKYMDLWIVERGNYAVIFENKLKGACFQRNQLARYIQTIKDLDFSYDQIFLVLIPLNPDFKIHWIPESVWRLPQDGMSNTNGNRFCSLRDCTHCWCDENKPIINEREIYCKECNTSIKNRMLPHTIILGKDFSQWMVELENKIESRERNVRSSLLQFADYFDYLYNNRLNILMEEEIDKYIETKLPHSIDKSGWVSLRTKLNELEELKKSIKRVRRELSRKLIDKWYNELKGKWPNMEYKPHESFGYIIDKNIWVGCRFYYKNENDWDAGDDDQPFWVFRRNDYREASQRQLKIVKSILAQCNGIKGKWDDESCIVWDNTLTGDKRCDELFSAAEELGYLKV